MNRGYFAEDVVDFAPSHDVVRRQKNGHIKINVITNVSDFDALELEWSELARTSDTTIFQTFEWNRIWWTHFGARKQLHILTVYHGRTLVGIAPLFEDDISLFGQKVYSCLRFLGSFVSQPDGKPLIGTISYSDYLDCIIHPGSEKVVYESIIQHVNDIRSQFNEIILDEASSESSICKSFIPLMAMSPCGLSFHVSQASSSPVIRLDSSWEAFLNTMTVKDRYNARRYFNRSNHGTSAVFSIEKINHAQELRSVLNDFYKMHQKQWNKRGFAGTFSEKRMCDFFTEISTAFHQKDWIEFKLAIPIDAKTTYVAVDAYLTYKNRVSLMHRGMDEDPMYRKLGPGNSMLFTRIHQAIEDGVDVFDMLRGSEEFKLRLATTIQKNKQILIGPDSTSGKLRIGVVKTLMKVIQLVRIEALHISIVFDGKAFFKGFTDYYQFLNRRMTQRVQG